jgi:hypothetical protein
MGNKRKGHQMIFTPEQISRLPGSLVRRADGKKGICGELACQYDDYCDFFFAEGEWCDANTSNDAWPSMWDITSVLRWSDEPAQATEVEALRAEVERLRGALKQAFHVADYFRGQCPTQPRYGSFEHWLQKLKELQTTCVDAENGGTFLKVEAKWETDAAIPAPAAGEGGEG